MNHKTIVLIRLLCAATFLCARTGSAQLALPAPQPVIGARMPALSPDGKRLAFVHRGDIWIAASEGERASPWRFNSAGLVGGLR